RSGRRGCRPSEVATRTDRRRRLAVDHVQRVRHHDQRDRGSADRRPSSRGTLERDLRRHRVGVMIDADDLILISVDDHIIEPPDLFADHLPAKYLDRAPKLLRNEQGNDVWVFGQLAMETAALNAVAGRPKSEYGMEPQSLDEVRPGCYDVHERVKDMD